MRKTNKRHWQSFTPPEMKAINEAKIETFFEEEEGEKMEAKVSKLSSGRRRRRFRAFRIIEKREKVEKGSS